jgi:ATP-dependent DNA helicase DinG
MLDRAMPSRLGGAFPDGVEIERIGLAEAVAATASFLSCDR